MIKHAKVLSAVFVTAFLFGCEQKSDFTGEVAYINLTKILNESEAGNQEKARNQKVKDVLVQAEQDAQSVYQSMNKEEALKARAADELSLNNEWARSRQKSRTVTLKTITEKVEEVRKQKKYKMVMAQENIMAADNSLDMTQDVINQLKETKIDYGALPQITINKINGPKEAPKENQ